MDDFIDIIIETAEPVVDAIMDWCGDAVQIAKDHAPQYAAIALKALKGIL